MDEAHALKNANSQRSRRLRKLAASEWQTSRALACLYKFAQKCLPGYGRFSNIAGLRTFLQH